MLLLLLACLPSSDVDERLAALEEENAALRARVEALEDASRQTAAQLAALEASPEASEEGLTISEGSAPVGAAGGGCTTGADGQVRVNRSLLDDTTALASSVRVIPHKDASGQVDGYRLSGIRRGSILASCGFKNGDIVHSVNGHALTSVSGAMEVYSNLADARHVTINATRRGQAVSLTLGVD